MCHLVSLELSLSSSGLGQNQKFCRNSLEPGVRINVEGDVLYQERGGGAQVHKLFSERH